MNKRIAQGAICDGALALQPVPSRFTVIEGGLSKNRSRTISKRNKPARQSTVVRQMGAWTKNDIRIRAARNAHAVARPTLFASCMALVLTLAAFGIAWHISDVSAHQRVSEALSQASYQTVIVRSGDTLWNIAESHPIEGCSTQELVHYITELNSLESACLGIGAEIVIPCNEQP